MCIQASILVSSLHLGNIFPKHVVQREPCRPSPTASHFSASLEQKPEGAETGRYQNFVLVPMLWEIGTKFVQSISILRTRTCETPLKPSGSRAATVPTGLTDPTPKNHYHQLMYPKPERRNSKQPTLICTESDHIFFSSRIFTY